VARPVRPARFVPRVAWLIAIVLMLGPSAPPHAARMIVVAATNQSFNWSGYQQGVFEKGTPFRSISADWIVPRARQHRAGEAEYSSSWIGIGGGCLDTSCTSSDTTLIQAGVEHDVDAAGNAQYYAWWETIPAPLVSVDLAVRPGDLVHVDITESTATPEVWTIAIANRTTGGTFSITLPYTSSYATAEWVIETPVAISETGVSVGPMPDLTTVRFDHATTNGAAVTLVSAEQIELVDVDLSLIARPSLPDRDANGFNDCTYRRQCPVPGSALH